MEMLCPQCMSVMNSPDGTIAVCPNHPVSYKILFTLSNGGFRNGRERGQFSLRPSFTTRRPNIAPVGGLR